MNANNNEPKSCLSAGIRWVVQQQGVLIVDVLAGRSVLLTYPHATIWELLAQGKKRNRILALLQMVLGKDETEVSRLLDASLDQWREWGWIGSHSDKGVS